MPAPVLENATAFVRAFHVLRDLCVILITSSDTLLVHIFIVVSDDALNPISPSGPSHSPTVSYRLSLGQFPAATYFTHHPYIPSASSELIAIVESISRGPV